MATVIDTHAPQTLDTHANRSSHRVRSLQFTFRKDR